ncbi:transcription factor HES-1-like [Tubulanus polymorphus]|uniref:transcription factor HES-1-like n=1 Tax=Tubulanus polymorphus TaxID=672921 RepID=UPI003DA4549A
MEKKRRARINKCLVELKSLILETMQKDTSTPGYNKLEKADILELTVKYLRDVRNKRDSSHEKTRNTKMYQSGYSACAKEVAQFMYSFDGVDQGMRARVLNHVISSLDRLHNSTDVGGATEEKQTSPPEDPVVTPVSSRESSPIMFGTPTSTPNKTATTITSTDLQSSPGLFSPVGGASRPTLYLPTTVPYQLHNHSNYQAAPGVPMKFNYPELMQPVAFSHQYVDQSMWRPW